MITWRESRWFRAVAVLVVALLSGGFARVVLGLVASAAEANRGAAAVAASVVFALTVRAALRRFRTGAPGRRRRLAPVADLEDVEELERLYNEPD